MKYRTDKSLQEITALLTQVSILETSYLQLTSHVYRGAFTGNHIHGQRYQEQTECIYPKQERAPNTPT